MSNNTSAAAACCQYKNESGNAGYGTGKSISLSALVSGAPGARGELLETIKRAVDNAIHGGNSGYANGAGVGASSSDNAGYLGGSGNVIPFPMVNPFKSITKTNVPIPGLNRNPRHVYYLPPDPSGVPDDEQFAGLGSLGATWSEFDPGYPGYSLEPGKLQSILGTIQATLPATIQAIRAQPANIFPGTSYNPYAPGNAGGVYPGMQQPYRGAGADIGASAGAAAGNVADSIGGIVQRHPLLVLGAGAAVLLLFMNPPRRR